MSDSNWTIGVLLVVLTFGLGIWIGWAIKCSEDHSEAVASGHAEYRRVVPPDGVIVRTEFVWLPGCAKDKNQ